MSVIQHVYLQNTCQVNDPVEYVGYKIAGRKGKKFVKVFVRKALHPMLADGYTLKGGVKGDITPVIFNIATLIKITYLQFLPNY